MCIFKHITVYDILYISFHFIGTANRCFKLSQGKQYPPEGLEALLCPFDPQCLGFASLHFVVNGGCADQKYVIIIIYMYIQIYLVGGLEHFLFSIKYGIILPIDFDIFQYG